MVVSSRRSGDRPGSLSLLVLGTNTHHILADDGAGDGRGRRWGDPGCERLPQKTFSPHGISLRRSVDEALMLAVVQHGGGRESVEFFQLAGHGADWNLTWRGCVVAPPDMHFNDVSLFANGGFVATHTGTPTRPSAVYRWDRKQGFAEVPGTRGDYANGVQLSPDEKSLIATYSFGNEVRLVSVGSGKRLASVQVPSPDNVSWTRGGMLLVASVDMSAGPSFPECFAAASGACAKPYRIMRFTAKLQHGRTLYAGGSALMGAASVGVMVGRYLYVGSAAGDRMLCIALPAA